jgi:hypothetical protein
MNIYKPAQISYKSRSYLKKPRGQNKNQNTLGE